MPKGNHKVRFKYPPHKFLGEDLTETDARALAKSISLASKNRAVEVQTANGAAKALFLNGKDVS